MIQDTTFIRYSISYDEIKPKLVIAKNHTQEFRDTSDAFKADADNGEGAANQICEQFITESAWNHAFGRSASKAAVVVEIHEPERLAGTYDVQLERIVRASAARRDG